MASIHEIFCSGPEFCNLCGSILPILTGKPSDDHCSVCHAPVLRNTSGEPEILETVSYEVHFNESNVYSKQRDTSTSKKTKKNRSRTADGPVVSRDCKQCGNTKMTYTTLQLRSADEGQTVFFTCPKCKFKESENS